MDLWECALGFMDSQTLLTAEELGLFNALDRQPSTTAEVAEAIGVPLGSADRLLVALCALGIVEKQPDGRYRNGPDAAERLVEGKPGYMGAMFHHVREDLYPLWNHLKEALVEERAPWDRAFPQSECRKQEIFGSSDELRAFMEGMHAITYPAAVEFASYAGDELADIRSIVDVGGASGAFLIALAEAHPQLRGTVFDLPAVQPIAEDFFQRANVQDRLSFQPGDFWSDPLPRGADAYALGFILHDWNTDQGSFLLQRIADAAPPGARLIVGESMLWDDRTGPLHVARQHLNMLVAARGQERSAPEYGNWLREFGFEYERLFLTSKGKNFMILRRQTDAGEAVSRTRTEASAPASPRVGRQ